MNKQAIARIDLEPLGGIAGDMFAAAMFDGFPQLFDAFQSDLRVLGVDGLSATIEDRLSSGLHAKYFSVQQNTTQKPPRTLAAVKEFFQSKAIEEPVARHAIGLFTELAKAESEVHGKTIDTIHFHEVSDWDSMVDIVAAAGVIARLQCPVWRIGALPLGNGTVHTAHGDIPVPAPATLALLRDFQWHDDGVSGERVTPTGAAILSYLQASPSNTAAGVATLSSVGSGCGSRTFKERANILRMTAFAAGESKPNSAAVKYIDDEVFRLAFEVDDMTAEEIAWAAERLQKANGMLDVCCINLHGKKNRPSTGFRIICLPGSLHSVVEQSFLLTSTIGIRYNEVRRFVLPRAEINTENTNVKVVERPLQMISAKASSDDLASVETLAERRQQAHTEAESALITYRRNSDNNSEENQ